MHSRRKACGLVALMAMLAACSSAASDELTPAARSAAQRFPTGPVATEHDVLLLATGSGVAAIEAATGRKVFATRAAIMSPDHSLLYSKSGRREAPRVTTLDAATGRKLANVAIPRNFELGVSSTSGASLALVEPHERGVTPWLPAGKAHTRLVIVSPDGSDKPRKLRLDGNFELEAFSTDERQLFLIEYMPAMNPSHYKVRRLKIGSEKVLPIKPGKQNAPGLMRGTGRVQIFSPKGDELYTLYTQQGPNYAHGGGLDHDPGETHAFIHLLNLEGAWTHCIDLPMPFGTGPVTTHALAMSADGTRLFVADPSSGGLAVIDPAEARVVKSVTMNLRRLRHGHASAEVAPDGTLYLAGGSRVLVIDGESLRVLHHEDMPTSVTGIALDSTGRHLYVGQKNRLVALDPATGERTGTLRPSRAVDLGRVTLLGD